MFLSVDRNLVVVNFALGGAVLFVMLVIAALGVLFRFGLHAALPWAEEANMYLFVWLTCLGATVGFRQRSHPQVDALTVFGPSWVAPLSRWLSALALLALGLVFLVYGGRLVEFIGEETGSAIPFSMAYPYASIPYAAACMAVHAISLALEGAPPVSSTAINSGDVA
jgi:TRAP-type C4-dicarboxylate transport system permease small subunit